MLCTLYLLDLCKYSFTSNTDQYQVQASGGPTVGATEYGVLDCRFTGQGVPSRQERLETEKKQHRQSRCTRQYSVQSKVRTSRRLLHSLVILYPLRTPSPYSRPSAVSHHDHGHDWRHPEAL